MWFVLLDWPNLGNVCLHWFGWNQCTVCWFGWNRCLLLVWLDPMPVAGLVGSDACCWFCWNRCLLRFCWNRCLLRFCWNRCLLRFGWNRCLLRFGWNRCLLRFAWNRCLFRVDFGRLPCRFGRSLAYSSMPRATALRRLHPGRAVRPERLWIGRVQARSGATAVIAKPLLKTRNATPGVPPSSSVLS